MGEPLRVGVVGLGDIWRQYSAFFAGVDVEVVAVADLDEHRVAAAIEQWPSAVGCDTDRIFEADLDVVVNLTTPRHHVAVASASVAAGVPVYGEKPLATSVADATGLVDAGREADVPIGCAPDTVLGTGIQTARHIVDRGDLGHLVGASATMVVPGHEAWHPNPDFYYQTGGGPLFDMGPYYLTTLVHLLGPVAEVMGSSSRSRSERTIGTGPRIGETVPVEVDTHLAGVLVHEGGAISTVVMSFDAVATATAAIEVHGTAGSLQVPDPNRFDGTPRLRRLGDDAWRDVAASAGYVGVGRGVGVLDMMRGEHRANADIALHVLDVMESLSRAAGTNATVALSTTVARPSAVPLAADVDRQARSTSG